MVVHEACIVLRREIAEPQAVGMAEIVQAGGLAQIPKTEQIMAHVEQVPGTEIRRSLTW
jgi:hypothetical protein